jgi:hypothetical protein
MTRMAALDEDYHVHSVFSDGISTIDENVIVARQRGLRTLCLVDHVRADTTWVGDFVSAVWPLRKSWRASRPRSWTGPGGSTCRPASTASTWC